MGDNLAEKRDRLFNIVKSRGPILPVDVSKEIGTDIIFASAMLSELVSNKKVKITNVKIGGGPLYYVEGQEHKLQDLVKHLNSKDRDVAERLKKEKILRDIECKPLERVSLRQIKDYAVPIKVNNNNQIEIFWRWYLYNEEEAKEKIIEVLKPKLEFKQEFKEPEKEISQPERIQKELEVEKQQEVKQGKEEPKKRIKKPKKEDLSFEDRVLDYFNKNGIEIIEEKLIKKNKEMNYTVKVSSGIGKLDYFVKVKNKTRISETDLSLAHNEAGKLPLFFISNGSLSKKGEETLGSILKSVVFKKI